MLVLMRRTGNNQEFSRLAGLLEQLLPPNASIQRVHLLRLLASHHAALLEMGESMHYIVQALAIATKNVLVIEQGKCLDVLARNQLHLGLPAKALATARAAIRIRMRHNLKSGDQIHQLHRRSILHGGRLRTCP